MRPLNIAPLNAVPANANKSSGPVWSDFMIRLTIQAVATAANTGTVQLQGSNDLPNGPGVNFIPTNWDNIGSALTLSGTTPVLGPVVECSYEYLRLVYTDASGGTATGTVSARIKALGM